MEQISFEEGNDVKDVKMKIKQEIKMEIDASGCQLDDCIFHSGHNFLNLNGKDIKI